MQKIVNAHINVLVHDADIMSDFQDELRQFKYEFGKKQGCRITIVNRQRAAFFNIPRSLYEVGLYRLYIRKPENSPNPKPSFCRILDLFTDSYIKLTPAGMSPFFAESHFTPRRGFFPFPSLLEEVWG